MGSAISTATASTAAFLGSPKKFEVVMVGLDEAGKTGILNRFHRRELPRGVLPATIPTIGGNYETFTYSQHRISLWDFGGHEKIRPLWRRYFWNGHAFIFVLDATAPTRFAEAKQELTWLWEGTEKQHPILVLANKMDLAGAVGLNAIEEALGIEKIASSGRAITLKGISAMTGDGVDEALEWLLQNISYLLIAETDQAKKNVEQAW
ncbi:ADP-ribosylation factor family-domain-containing protein [Favolaschia claudopus]|uniref:ADP-ribosylation factor family-domain-containing protein n=1 Tax=Favolaschia claudopus TaxID=2862362 RepID=A0AAW0BGX7_9AGAR